MILRRLATALHRQDRFIVLLEVTIVVAGILIALQVDQWAQARQGRTLEQDYLHRLRNDLEIERQRVESALGYACDRVVAVRLLERLASDPSAAVEHPARVPWAVETASWRSFPRITVFVYRKLQNTGAMTLLRSVELRRMLAEHYQQIEHDRGPGAGGVPLQAAVSGWVNACRAGAVGFHGAVGCFGTPTGHGVR